jgi:hypothetical protein
MRDRCRERDDLGLPLMEQHIVWMYVNRPAAQVQLPARTETRRVPRLASSAISSKFAADADAARARHGRARGVSPSPSISFGFTADGLMRKGNDAPGLLVVVLDRNLSRVRRRARSRPHSRARARVCRRACRCRRRAPHTREVATSRAGAAAGVRKRRSTARRMKGEWGEKAHLDDVGVKGRLPHEKLVRVPFFSTPEDQSGKRLVSGETAG